MPPPPHHPRHCAAEPEHPLLPSPSAPPAPPPEPSAPRRVAKSGRHRRRRCRRRREPEPSSALEYSAIGFVVAFEVLGRRDRQRARAERALGLWLAPPLSHGTLNLKYRRSSPRTRAPLLRRCNRACVLWPPVWLPQARAAAEVEGGETELARRARRQAPHVPLTALRSPQAQLAPTKLVSSPAPGLRARAGAALEYSRLVTSASHSRGRPRARVERALGLCARRLRYHTEPMASGTAALAREPGLRSSDAFANALGPLCSARRPRGAEQSARVEPPPTAPAHDTPHTTYPLYAQQPAPAELVKQPTRPQASPGGRSSTRLTSAPCAMRPHF